MNTLRFKPIKNSNLEKKRSHMHRAAGNDLDNPADSGLSSCGQPVHSRKHKTVSSVCYNCGENARGDGEVEGGERAPSFQRHEYDRADY